MEADTAPHAADPASPAGERDDALAVLERVQAELNDVERTLERMDDGSYGTCQVCGCEIDDERLEAMPAERFCIEHQPKAVGGAQTDGTV